MSAPAKKAKTELRCEHCGEEQVIIDEYGADDPDLMDSIDIWNDMHKRCGLPASVKRIQDHNHRTELHYPSCITRRKLYDNPGAPSWLAPLGDEGDGHFQANRKLSVGRLAWSSSAVNLPAKAYPGLTDSDGTLQYSMHRLHLQQGFGERTPRIKIERTYPDDDATWIDTPLMVLPLDEARALIDALQLLIEIGEAG